MPACKPEFSLSPDGLEGSILMPDGSTHGPYSTKQEAYEATERLFEAGQMSLKEATELATSILDSTLLAQTEQTLAAAMRREAAKGRPFYGVAMPQPKRTEH